MKPTYRQSEINMAQKCLLAYFYRKDGIIIPPSAALTVGTSVDVPVSKNLEQKIESGVDLPLTDVLEIASDTFDKRAPETEWGEEDKGAQKDLAIALTKAHHENIAGLIQPETVQEPFEISLEDREYNISGTIDCVEKTGFVVDTKTSNKMYAPESSTRAIQPAMYDFAYEATRKKKARGWRYDVLVKPTKTIPVRTQRVESVVTKEDRDWLFYVMDSVHKAIQAGVAVPPPEGVGAWWCSKKFCGYSKICPKFGGKGK